MGLPIIILAVLAFSINTAVANVVCQLSAQSGLKLNGSCSVGGGPASQLSGPGTGLLTDEVAGVAIRWTIASNGISTLFECSSKADILIITSSTYSNQTLTNCDAPLIELRGCSDASVQDSTFTNITRSAEQPLACTASEYGAGVVITGTSSQSDDWSVTILRNTFTNVYCSSSEGSRLGGALALEKEDSVGAMRAIVGGSTFTNTSCDFGGAIQSTYASLTVRDSTFTKTSAEDGGAIQFISGNQAGDIQMLRVDYSTFTTVSAIQNGGAVAAYQGDVTIVDSTFTTGDALHGECVWLAECGSYVASQIRDNTWTRCSPVFTTWCKPQFGNVWSSCGMAGPDKCYNSPPSPPARRSRK